MPLLQTWLSLPLLAGLTSAGVRHIGTCPSLQPAANFSLEKFGSSLVNTTWYLYLTEEPSVTNLTRCLKWNFYEVNSGGLKFNLHYPSDKTVYGNWTFPIQAGTNQTVGKFWVSTLGRDQGDQTIIDLGYNRWIFLWNCYIQLSFPKRAYQQHFSILTKDGLPDEALEKDIMERLQDLRRKGLKTAYLSKTSERDCQY